MATIPLKDITFPGLDNTYTIPEIDNTLSTAGKAADAKKTGDEIDQLKSDLKNSFVDGEYEISKNYPENEWITVPYSQGTNQGTGYYNRNGELIPGMHHHYDLTVKGADSIYISANANAGVYFGVIKTGDDLYNRFPSTQGQQYAINLDPDTEYTILVNAFDGFNVIANIHYPQLYASTDDLTVVFNKTGELFSTTRYDGLYKGGVYTQLGTDSFSYSTETAWNGVLFKIPVEQNKGYIFSYDVALASGGCFINILDETKSTRLVGKTLLSTTTYKGAVNSGTNNYLYVRFEGTSANSAFTIANGTFMVEKAAYAPFHIVRRPFSFSEKTCVFVGDSITRGNTDGLTVTANGFPKLFCDAVGATMTNLGVSGATMTADFMSQLQSASKTCDYLFVSGGVNDWQTGVSLENFKTAVTNICDYINENFLQTTKVVFITPINQAGYDLDHALNNFTNLQTYRNIITQVVIENDEYARFSILQGNLFGFPEAGADSAFINSVFGDKLHPSELGYKLYSAGLFTALC